jgi:hypothetical protein
VTQRQENPDTPTEEMGPDGMGEPVHLLKTQSEFQATWIADALTQNGIPARVFGANANSMAPWGALVPVWVLVHRADYELAREALESGEIDGLAPRGERSRCLACKYDLTGLEDAERCPECGAECGAVGEPLRYEFAPHPPSPRARRILAVFSVLLSFVIFGGAIVLIALAII